MIGHFFHRVRQLHYFTILATLILLLFLAAIMRDHIVLIVLFVLGLFGIFGSVISTIWDRTLPRLLSFVCAAMAIAGGIPISIPGTPAWVDRLGLLVCCLAYTIFILVAIVSICRTVFVTDRVTSNRIVGSICIYLLIGMLFAFMYASIAIVIPGAIHFGTEEMPMAARISDFLYFSYSTLTTTGYGDMVPTHSVTKMLASMEGVTGSVYLAIMVARLVGMHVTQRHGRG